MPISQINGNERLRAAGAALRANAAYSTAPTPTRQPDSVSLSDEARALSAAHKAVATAPEVRDERVQAIKAAIASGTYSINSRNIARAIIDNGVERD